MTAADGLAAQMAGSEGAAIVFADDFEDGLDRWTFPLGTGRALVDTGDPAHGHVLALRTRALQVHALAHGSERWGDVRIEGEVLFPEDVDNYLGFIYRYVDDGRRIDFGSVYIKGNGSYAQANPHRDTNVGRTLYPERRAPLEGASAIEIGEWHRFALEVVGSEAHLYVGEATTPQLTLRSPEAARGAFGFKPRNPGGAVWIDDVRVRSIDGFSYRGPPRPDLAYRPAGLVTEWDVLGPLTRMSTAVEAGPFDPGRVVEDDGREVGWRPFETDHRGAVVTGRVTEYHGSRRVAYFHTVLWAEAEAAPGAARGTAASGPHGRRRTGADPRADAGHARDAVLELSTVDALALWLNGEFLGFAPAGDRAWWDAGENPDHGPTRARVELRPGANHLVVRAAGGVYATGGFFLRVRRAEDVSARVRRSPAGAW